MIDFRSDTFTKPSPAMLEAMWKAEVGDDVYGEDASVNQLETFCADLFGMEAAVFCPSGTMTNQIAIKCHTQPGDEVICEKLSHVYIYEGGGIAFNSSASVKPLAGSRGLLTASQISEAINPDDIHKPVTSLVSLENTANRGGGSCYDLGDIEAIKQICMSHNLALHLDGARLFNALIATGQTPVSYGRLFDSISICLSKGLGSPVGSVLLGKQNFIRKARRIRKVFGGGMRQAGYLAAAGLFALHNNVARLAEDHRRAKLIAEALLEKEFVQSIEPVETNIVIVSVAGTYTPETFKQVMYTHGILVTPISKTQVRIVTHLDVTEQMMTRTIETIKNL